MTGGDIALILTASGTLITAIGSLIVVLRRVEKVHEEVVVLKKAVLGKGEPNPYDGRNCIQSDGG